MGDVAELKQAIIACRGDQACINEAIAAFKAKPDAKVEGATAYTDTTGTDAVVVTDGGKVFYGGKVF